MARAEGDYSTLSDFELRCIHDALTKYIDHPASKDWYHNADKAHAFYRHTTQASVEGSFFYEDGPERNTIYTIGTRVLDVIRQRNAMDSADIALSPFTSWVAFCKATSVAVNKQYSN